MPLDTRIALGVQPLQVQFRDPIAGYNQLAQLQSADTQNQLAQMQMQEARQLAPLRMQERQNRAAAAKLTFDEANEAQTYIKSVMTKAAEASGGSAPTDPFEAAKQMMEHPNAQVQAAGLRLLESSQKLQAYKQQAQFLKDEGGAAVVPTPTDAPAVVAPSVSNVAAPMVAPGTPAPNVASALSRFVAGTKDMPDGRVGPYFSIGGQPVSEEQYLSGREAIMLPQSANALAPAVAAAPAVNAMIPAVASALQNADALKKEIEKGDRTYGQAPAWKSKRELLVKAYEQALKPGRADTTFAAINPSDYTPESVKAFLVSKNYGDLVPKAGKTDKLIGNVNPSDYTPASLAVFASSGKYEDLVLKPAKAEKADKLIGNVNPSDYTPESVKAFSLSNDYGDLVLKPAKADKVDRTIANVNPDSYTPASVAAFAISGNYADLVLRPEKAKDSTNIANVNPNDFTPASIQKFVVSGKYSDLVPVKKASEGGAGGEKMPTGSILVIDPTDAAKKRVILVTQARAIKENLTPASSTKEAQMPQGYLDRADKLQNVNDAIRNYAKVLDTYKTGDILNLQKRGQFSTAHSTALLQAKELFALGVLNGGDEVILNKVLASPVDFSAAAIPIATIKQQVKDLQKVVESANKNLAKTYKQDVIPLNTDAPPPDAAGSSAISAADAILKKGK